MRTSLVAATLMVGLFWPVWLGQCAGKESGKKPTPLERYVEDARRQADYVRQSSTPGSLWNPSAELFDLAADLRATRVNDMVTVLVREQASAVSQGSVESARASSARAAITALGGIPSAAGALQNLLDLSSSHSLDGEGATSRNTVLTTTITARVVERLPNGFLVIEGEKNVVVDSENQVISVRGVVRPIDISTGNVVLSDHIGQMEIKVNGKGVVGDAVRRPNFFYRLLLGLLPF